MIKAWRARWPRVSAELLLLLLGGLFMGAIGPFDTDAAPPAKRLVYWLCCIIGGGAIGVLIDEGLGRRTWRQPVRVVAIAFMMTPPVTVWVLVANHLFLGDAIGAQAGRLAWQVLVVSMTLMAVRAVANRAPERVVETRTLIEAPLPEAEATFRRRLSAKRRHARLVAVEAHDHYLRVHTAVGTELLTMRMGDALRELERAAGLQIHRSWWVATDAIESVRWSRGSGTARLSGAVEAPVSRSFAPKLREAGWK